LQFSDYVFVKDFLTRTDPSSLTPAPAPQPKPASKVQFSEPPIATLNNPAPSSFIGLRPLSSIPIPSLEEFPSLAGKPFGDTWTTVSKRGKKKKQGSTIPAPGAAPLASSLSTASGPAPSFAQATASSSSAPPVPTPSSKPKPQPIWSRTPDALWSTRYSIILNHSCPDIREMLGIDAGHIFRNIRADLEWVNAPLTLLAGHWSSATINKNFILTFAGLQKRDNIAKYDSIFFCPFGPDCHGAPMAVGPRWWGTILLFFAAFLSSTIQPGPSPHLPNLTRRLATMRPLKVYFLLPPP
jgi:hypothetical protein